MNRNTLLKLCTLVLLLIGCSTPKRLENRLERTYERLEKKGVYIPKDTVRTSDTIISRIAIGDTVFITKEITKTLEPKIEYKTKREVRYETKYKYKTVKVENRAMVDSLRQELKLAKENTKVTRIENRNRWWLWLLIGITIGFFLPYAHKIMSYDILSKKRGL